MLPPALPNIDFPFSLEPTRQSVPVTVLSLRPAAEISNKPGAVHHEDVVADRGPAQHRVLADRGSTPVPLSASAGSPFVWEIRVCAEVG
jgi:hypothetical protein